MIYNKIKHLFYLPAADIDSLYSLISRSPKNIVQNLETRVKSYVLNGGHLGFVQVSTKCRHLDVTNLFVELSRADEPDYLDENLLLEIEKSTPSYKTLFSDLLNENCNDAFEFCHKFNHAAQVIKPFFLEKIFGDAGRDSLRESYNYVDIAELLCKTGPLIDDEIIFKRAQDTGSIMALFFSQNHLCIIALLLHVMHYIRFAHHKTPEIVPRPYYNQGSSLFTLLTLSVGMGVPTDVQQQPYSNQTAWFRFWKIFGSLFGLSSIILPNNYEEAQLLFFQMRMDRKLCGETPEKLILDACLTRSLNLATK